MGSVQLTGMSLATVVGMVLGLVFYILDRLGLTNDRENEEMEAAEAAAANDIAAAEAGGASGSETSR